MGQFPAASIASTMAGSSPSSPITITFFKAWVLPGRVASSGDAHGFASGA